MRIREVRVGGVFRAGLEIPDFGSANEFHALWP